MEGGEEDSSQESFEKELVMPEKFNPLLPLIQRFILFSAGDTTATEEIFHTLENKYSKIPHELKKNMIYTLEDLVTFPEMIRKRARTKLTYKEIWKVGNEKKESKIPNDIIKIRKNLRNKDKSALGIGSTKRIIMYHTLLRQDEVYSFLESYIWRRDFNRRNLISQHNDHQKGSDKEIEETRDKIIEFIRNHKISDLYCSFLSSGYKKISRPFFKVTRPYYKDDEISL